MQPDQCDDAQPDSDTALLTRIAGGDEQALHSFYQRHGLPLLNFLIERVGERALAEEVLQNTMLAVWRGASTFRGESQVRTWLFAIASNQAKKASRTHSPSHLPLQESQGVDTFQPDDLPQIEALQAALQHLSAIEREVLELIFYRGYSIGDAATYLHIPANTVKSRLYRAQAVLKKQLIREVSDEHDSTVEPNASHPI